MEINYKWGQFANGKRTYYEGNELWVICLPFCVECFFAKNGWTKKQSTLPYLPKVHSILLVGDNLSQVDNVFMVQLSQYLDLTHRGDGEPFLLILESDFLKGDQLSGVLVPSFVHLSVCTFTYLRDHLQGKRLFSSMDFTFSFYLIHRRNVKNTNNSTYTFFILAQLELFKKTDITMKKKNY